MSGSHEEVSYKKNEPVKSLTVQFGIAEEVYRAYARLELLLGKNENLQDCQAREDGRLLYCLNKADIQAASGQSEVADFLPLRGEWPSEKYWERVKRFFQRSDSRGHGYVKERALSNDLLSIFDLAVIFAKAGEINNALSFFACFVTSAYFDNCNTIHPLINLSEAEIAKRKAFAVDFVCRVLLKDESIFGEKRIETISYATEISRLNTLLSSGNFPYRELFKSTLKQKKIDFQVEYKIEKDKIPLSIPQQKINIHVVVLSLLNDENSRKLYKAAMNASADDCEIALLVNLVMNNKMDLIKEKLKARKIIPDCADFKDFKVELKSHDSVDQLSQAKSASGSAAADVKGSGSSSLSSTAIATALVAGAKAAEPVKNSSGTPLSVAANGQRALSSRDTHPFLDGGSGSDIELFSFSRQPEPRSVVHTVRVLPPAGSVPPTSGKSRTLSGSH